MAEYDPPHIKLHGTEISERIMNGPAPVIKLEIWSNRFQRFIYKCLQKDPANRPFAKQLLFHRFITYNRDEGEVQYSIAEHIKKGNVFLNKKMEKLHHMHAKSAPKYRCF
ncbi:germinal center kinase 1-like [Xenopus laevis]|uniref:Germinal center kinase 1-like n=1 Tax=Xenopus laevis TaxID=8355 RepID=A0A8J1KW77_XENLA|nr:germinal center kinase 1-like [Xenopus laevis]